MGCPAASHGAASELARIVIRCGLGAELRVLTVQPEQAMDSVRVCWLAGRVASGLGRTSEAIEALV